MVVDTLCVLRKRSSVHFRPWGKGKKVERQFSAKGVVIRVSDTYGHEERNVVKKGEGVFEVKN